MAHRGLCKVADEYLTDVADEYPTDVVRCSVRRMGPVGELIATCCCPSGDGAGLFPGRARLRQVVMTRGGADLRAAGADPYELGSRGGGRSPEILDPRGYT